MKTLYTTLILAVTLSYVPSSSAQSPSVEALIKTIEDPDASPHTKNNAINQLRPFKENAAPAIPLLERLSAAVYPTKDLNTMSNNAAGALCYLGKPAVPALVRTMKLQTKGYKFASQSVEALGKMGPDAKEAVPALLAMIDPKTLREHGAGTNCIHALHAICGDPKDYVPALSKVIQSHCAEVIRPTGAGMAFTETRVAISTLGKLGARGKDGVPALLEVLRLKPTRDYSYILSDALIALGQIGPEAKDALPDIRRYITSQDFSRQAEQAIAGIKGEAPPPVRRGK